MNSSETLHAVTVICHTLILIAIIVTAAILSEHNRLDTGTMGFLGALGGLTGSSLAINGRKVPPPGKQQDGGGGAP